MSSFSKLISAFTGKNEPPRAEEHSSVEMRPGQIPFHAQPLVPLAANVDITQRITLEGDPSAKFAPRIKPQFRPEKGLPMSQAEVDAIPPSDRGVSFFTSRPLPNDLLLSVIIRIGDQQHRVTATKREALLCRNGDMPRVRAFIVKGNTIPWYDFTRYDPYKHFWTMEDRDWTGTSAVMPCVVKVEHLDPSLKGYCKSE